MTYGEWLRETPDGVSLAIRVIPRAGVTKIAGTREGRLLIRVAAAPVEGAANDALTRFLSALFKLPARHVTVASGAHGRNKLVKIAGVSAERAWSVISLPAEPA